MLRYAALDKGDIDRLIHELGIYQVKITQIISVITDISERKQAEERDRRLATVVIDSNDAITVQYLDGSITAWNKGAENMYGWSEEEARAMNIRDIVPEEKCTEAIDLIKKIIEEEL